MAQQPLKRQAPFGTAFLKAQAAIQNPGAPVPIPSPPSDPAEIEAEGKAFIFESFTAEDAIELGHFLYARLLPFAPEKICVISISLADNSPALFQTVTGSGVVPENDSWVQRKRNTVIRFGKSTWFMSRQFEGNEPKFAAMFAISDDKMGSYAIHGGGVPIWVKGYDGVAGVVVVSGLVQDEDHGVIIDVIKENWK